jgi:hypothetical protein
MTPADDEHAFTRATRRRRILLFIVIGALAAAPFVWLGRTWYRRSAILDHEREFIRTRPAREEAYRNRPLLPDEQRQLQQLAPSARHTVADNHARWRHDTSPGALIAVAPSDDDCPEPLPAPTLARDSDATPPGDDASHARTPGYDIYTVAQPIPDPGADADAALADQIIARVAAGILLRMDLERLQPLTAPIQRTFIVASGYYTGRVFPLRDGVRYVPGRLIGNAYVYRGGIVCAGPIDVQNSPTLEARYTYFPGVQQRDDQVRATEAALQRDMDAAIRAGLAASLRATR